ncbi:MAG TPA: chromosome segregation protein SMC [Candidatus Binataceae bacterium]|nr:chromosome segregation protein SMC [Candidatus Binataceae bacterium]
MRLKSLELVGFKSFCEQTNISFAPGVTAVVGPNGCGKSNVVDAIRWVLGEQAPTRLRGKNTEDLIYAGNETNAAAGMAEVSLVLEAEEGAALPEPYAMLSEVAVTRRVYRSGESDYLINKIPCRLKDITEFFMAAQIHSRSFAIIEQGRVDEIIQSKPHEIRGMIEEAAGLALFKGRRDLSERKLERVRENLARVDDVLSEIERQLNYARRQAKKAEAYKVIKAELSELERLQSGRRILDQRIELASETDREADLRARSEATRESLAQLQEVVAQASSATQAAESDLAQTRRELESIHAGSQQRARTRDFLARRLQSIDESEPDAVARLKELEIKATAARASRAGAGSSLALENNSGDGGEAELEELKHRHTQSQAELKTVEHRAEELKDELSDTVGEAAVIRGRLGDLAGERAELDERVARAEAEAPALAETVSITKEAVASAENALASARAEIESMEEGHRVAADHEMEARAAIEHTGAKVAALKEGLEAARLQIAAVEAARMAAREMSPLRTVLESLNGDRPATDPEILANVMRAPIELRPALSAVLGENLEAVIVDSEYFAARAIDILKEKNGGRLSFIPEPEIGIVAHDAIHAPGIAGRLIDMIGVDPRYANVVELMLGHVMLADDVRSALNASNLNGHGTLFVTRDGDVVTPGTIIRGGSAHRAEVAIETPPVKSLEEFESELIHAEFEHETLRERLAQRTAARVELAASLAQTRGRANESERGAIAARGEAAAAEQRLRMAYLALDSARKRLAEIREQSIASNVRLEELARSEQASRAQLSAMRDDVVTRRSELEQLGAVMLEAASRVEARRSRLFALEQEFRHASVVTKDLENQIDEGEARLARAREERAEFESELAKLAEQDEEARLREAELSDSITLLETRCADCVANLEARRAELKQAQVELQALEAETHECAIKCERARTLIAELLRTFIEKFAVEFAAVEAEIAVAIATRDSSADDTRIAELRAKAERIGEVNLAAESEVKELEERASKLQAERADLDAAVKDLTQTITKLNREARKRFAETFEGAAKNFEELFPKLLPGGKGRLELEQSDDVLEAGVNILVQPAGKKVKEIGLLSGGEKALSAMALIFSLFLLNPSPFCVMDEVDAPLDEFRLNAFTGLIAELKARSQFIIITHNQRTMQRADHIHGVTMDRPGVSKIISLKIPQAA